jgi:hypothetical protein
MRLVNFFCSNDDLLSVFAVELFQSFRKETCRIGHVLMNRPEMRRNSQSEMACVFVRADPDLVAIRWFPTNMGWESSDGVHSESSFS